FMPGPIERSKSRTASSTGSGIGKAALPLSASTLRNADSYTDERFCCRVHLDFRHPEFVRQRQKIGLVEDPFVVELRGPRFDVGRPEPGLNVESQRPHETGEVAVAIFGSHQNFKDPCVGYRHDERTRLERLDEDNPAAGLQAGGGVRERGARIEQMVEDRVAENEIERTLAEEPAMKVEAERTHAPTQ